AIGVGSHWDAGHAFDTARYGHVADAALDQVGGEVDRLLAGAALAVDGRRRRGDRKLGRQPGVAADVDRLLADLADAAEDDVFDLSGLDPRPLDQLFQDKGAEHDGVDLPELPVPAPKLRPDRFDDHCIAHFYGPPDPL